MLKTWQREHLDRALDLRRKALLRELDSELTERREALADEANDRLPDDVARFDTTIDLAELRDIDVARQRLAEGSYGICTDCGEEIGFERLHAEPQAQRCIGCQLRHEQTYR